MKIFSIPALVSFESNPRYQKNKEGKYLGFSLMTKNVRIGRKSFQEVDIVL